MITKRYCNRHRLRAVEMVPILVPVLTNQVLGCVVKQTRDLVYEIKCPVCWDNGERKKAFQRFKEGWQ